MSRLRTVFFGNHTVGIAALEVLAARSELVGIVAHPEDSEDGVRYESVFVWGHSRGIPTLRGRASDARVQAFVREAKPDLLWLTDYRYLIPHSLIEQARIGAVNLHPSLLPDYRGRAPINWAILRGETRLGLTAHLVDRGVDTGPILDQVAYELSSDEDVGDALRKLLPLYRTMTERVLDQATTGLQGRPQPPAATPPFPARKPADGTIDWSQPVAGVVNLVRAVARPYPGAFTWLGNRRLFVWRARATSASPSKMAPGTILHAGPAEVSVQCGDGEVRLLEYSWDGETAEALTAGQRFTGQVDEQAETALQYQRLLQQHGDSFMALNWGSQGGQQRRFEVLAGIADLSGRRILDVGCGLAHFADWLDSRGVQTDYTGLDLVPSLLAAASARRPRLKLVHGSILDPQVLAGERFDYVFASGIFYTYANGAEGVLRRSVERMWELARHGVAFNALSSEAPDQVAGEYYANPESVKQFCASLAPRVDLITNYHPRDFTVHMKRKR